MSAAPSEVNDFHKDSDVDSSPFAQHHTIGTKPNQAADGQVVAKLARSVAALESRIFALENP